MVYVIHFASGVWALDVDVAASDICFFRPFILQMFAYVCGIPNLFRIFSIIFQRKLLLLLLYRCCMDGTCNPGQTLSQTSDATFSNSIPIHWGHFLIEFFLSLSSSIHFLFNFPTIFYGTSNERLTQSNPTNNKFNMLWCVMINWCVFLSLHCSRFSSQIMHVIHSQRP